MIRIIYLIFCLSICFAFSEEEKKEKAPSSPAAQISSPSLDEEKAKKVNENLQGLRSELYKNYEKAKELYQNGASKEEFLSLSSEIKKIQKLIRETEKNFRASFADESSREEGYAFWDQGETTLSSLIMEYGSCDYLYIIPPELAATKITMYSTIPIPHDSWNEMIEIILNTNGIGVKQINPYLRQLFLLKQDISEVEAIAYQREDLGHIPENALVFYVFSPSFEQVKSIQAFFERFSDPKQTTIQIVGNKIVLVSTKRNVERLLQLHDAVWSKDGEKAVKVVKLSKITGGDAEKLIKSFFNDQANKSRPSLFQSKIDDIAIMALPDNALIVVGDGQVVEKAEKIIQDLENQLEDPGEMTIFWYTCKHSDPNDIADTLSKVYSNISGSLSCEEKKPPFQPEKKEEVLSVERPATTAYNPVLPVTPGFVQPGKIPSEGKKVCSSNNFVVDAKTGSILMTIRKEDLDNIKNLLKKLDVPKKMAQIDVLLVERKLQDQKQTGINILKIGTDDIHKKENAMSFGKKGILDFIFSKPKGHFPSFDLTLSFLMAQEDIKVNANPSILAINQTPAQISIMEELSINNGAIELDTSSGWTVQKSYTRAQFGINIVMTPTIHLADPDDENNEKGYVTLQTDVTFDSTHRSMDDRPPVTRRHIQNEVRIADGETIILGGLRKKSEEDTRDKIPFLGDLPGIGKLFGTTRLTDSSTEMFIFITPRIIKDPVEDLRQERQKFLMKRPGDIPEFLEKIEEAKFKERKKLFANSLKVIFE